MIVLYLKIAASTLHLIKPGGGFCPIGTNVFYVLLLFGFFNAASFLQDIMGLDDDYGRRSVS